METMAQVKNNLKYLRLTTFLENLELKNSEAIKNKMSYLDFLLSLRQDEVDRRKYKKKEMSVKRANLLRSKNIVEFDFDFNPKINRRQIMNLTSCEFIRKKENVVLNGPSGVGKTFISKAIRLEGCNRGFNVIFVRSAKMLETIYAAKADGTYQKKMNSFLKPDLLIIYDFGLQPFSANHLTILNEIIPKGPKTQQQSSPATAQ